MVETSLEIECNNCNHKFWYKGNKNYPKTIECPKCSKQVKIPEEA